ncbi:MAG: hypothetical protein QXU75_03380 [Candidatus Methanomethylicaceae archaeon]
MSRCTPYTRDADSWRIDVTYPYVIVPTLLMLAKLPSVSTG